jgi:hypothetical protein
MATTGDFADLLSRELGIARGQCQARAQELRDGKLMPIGGRGSAAMHLSVSDVATWLLALCLDPERGTVAKTTKAAKVMPRSATAETKPFGDLTVADAQTLGQAIEALIDDAVSRKLQRWKASGGSLRIDLVDGGVYADFEALLNGGVGQLGFARPNAHAKAPSAFRVFRIDCRVFEQIAQLLLHVEWRDPHSGERKTASGSRDLFAGIPDEP